MIKLDLTQSNNAYVIAVTGELDVRTSPTLRDALQKAANQGHRHVLVDLNHVEYLDSTGLGALVRGMRTLSAVDGRLQIVCDVLRIRRIFEIAGLGRVLDVIESREMAPAPIEPAEAAQRPA